MYRARRDLSSKPKNDKDPNLLASYLIGDHHLGMVAWTPETGDDNYDIDISTKLLFNAVDTLTSMSSHAHTGILLNLGDMMHANNLKNQTGSQTHTLDVDGRMGKAIRAVGQMYKRLITRMLEAHNEVWVINVRGNHDPDSSLWLNEMVKMYYENEPRVHVFDNYNKFLHFRWGYNLVALHHGDKINVQRLYEKITSSWRKNGVSLSIVSHGRVIYIINKRTKSVVFIMRAGTYYRRLTRTIQSIFTARAEA
jgi:hypothetical protein